MCFAVSLFSFASSDQGRVRSSSRSALLLLLFIEKFSRGEKKGEEDFKGKGVTTTTTTKT